jgi:hypothetical protein
LTHDLDTTNLARVLSQLSGDLILVIDAQGLIQVATPGQDTPAATGAVAWVGRRWVDTVTPETRQKVGKMLQELAANGRARRREINHPAPDGASIAFAYHAVRLGLSLAMGRDLRTQSALQQQLLRAQQQLLRAQQRAQEGWAGAPDLTGATQRRNIR